ncbi:MAG: hypothetical protein OIF50_10755 [Flavobacteriaceae bacterium]|nr:hypothetical protein [Flavobacteriaceae bacterium]
MKTTISVLLILACSFCSCVAQKETNSNELLPILEGIKKLPEENFYPNGGTNFQKIMEVEEDLTFFLIENINNVSPSSLEIPFIQSTFGDVALILLKYLPENQDLPLKNIISKQFYAGKPTEDFTLFDFIKNYFHSPNKTTNSNNRLQLQYSLQKWYTNKGKLLTKILEIDTISIEHRKENKTYKNLLRKGKEITPNLISLISHSQTTAMQYDQYLYCAVGDVAFLLLRDIHKNNNQFQIENILCQEMKIQNKNLCTTTSYDFLYHKLFFMNSKTENLKNRMNLKKVLKQYYTK